MKIISFFSFKGGVGRTALLANLGAYWAGQGKVVALVDMDLVAPGLTYSPLKGPPLDEQVAPAGISDMLLAFMEGGTEGDEITFIRPSLLLREMRLPAAKLHSRDGRLLLIDAGTRTGQLAERRWLGAERDPDQPLPRIAPAERQAGESREKRAFRTLAEAMRRDLGEWRLAAENGRPERPLDYVLIDCRTGYPELLDLSLGFLADQMVVLSGLNEQNLHGLELTLRALTEEGRIAVDMFPAQLLVVFSPVPAGEDAATLEALERGFGVIAGALRVNRAGMRELAPLTATIHYTPLLAISDRTVALAHPKALYSSEVERVARLIEGGEDLDEGEVSQEIRKKVLRIAAPPTAAEPAAVRPAAPEASSIADLPPWWWPLEPGVDPQERLDELVPANPEIEGERGVFLTMLCHSISLTIEEKKSIVEAVPRFSQFQFDELLNIIEQEQQRFVKLWFDQAKHRDELMTLYFKHQREWAGLVRGDEREGERYFLLAPLAGTPLFPQWEGYGRYWLLLARDLFLRLKEAEKAGEAFERARAIEHDDATAATRLLELCRSEQGTHALPPEVEDLALEVAPEAPAVELRVARSRLTRLGSDHAESLEMIERLLAEPPDDGQLCYELAAFAADSASFAPRAEAAARRAVEKLPRFARAWVVLGRFLQSHRREHKEAEAAYRQALTLDGKLAWAWQCLGALLHGLPDRGKDAERAYLKASELEPKNLVNQRNLGNLLANQGRYKGAEAAYRQAIALDPEDGAAWRSLGNLLNRHLGRHQEAEIALRRAVELDPAGSYGTLGDFLAHHLGRYDEAEVAYRKAVEFDEGPPPAWNSLGLFLRSYRLDYPAAHECFRRGLESEPNERYLRMNLGHLLILGGREEQGRGHLRAALAEFEKAAQANSDYVNRLRLAVELDDGAAVERHLEAVEQRLEQNPDTWLHFTMVAARLAAEDHEAARESWSGLVARLRSYNDAHHLLWDLYHLAAVRRDLRAEAAALAAELLALPEERTDSFRDVPTPARLLDGFRPFAEGRITGPGDPEDPLFQPL